MLLYLKALKRPAELIVLPPDAQRKSLIVFILFLSRSPMNGKGPGEPSPGPRIFFPKAYPKLSSHSPVL